MDIKFSVANYIQNHNQVMGSLREQEVESAIDLIIKTWDSDKQIVTCGNGGSASTASHFIMEWNKMINLATKKTIQRYLFIR